MNEFIFPFLFFGGVVLFPVLVIGFIVKYRNAKARKRTQQRQQAFQNGYPGRARIVDFRRSPHYRSNNFALYKVLLEVSLSDSQPSFSATVVWEIEPMMTNSMQIGNTFSVKINPADVRQVFPDSLGIRYSHQYQYVHLGLEDDFPPEQTITVQQLAPSAPKPKTIYRQRSKTFLFGLPLWEVAKNLNHRKYAGHAKARAIIAIGDSAIGLIAIGNIATGLIAIGRFSFGLISIGGFSFGIFSIGLFAIGLVALGTLAGGLLAIGGVSAGAVSAGLLQFGLYLFGKDFQSPIPAQLFQNFKSLVGLNYNVFDFAVIASIIVFAIFMLSMIGELITIKMLHPNSNLLESPKR